MAEVTQGAAPGAGEQMEASNALMSAKQQVQMAEDKLRASKTAAERVEAQKLLQHASGELEAVETKFKAIFDWQKAQREAEAAAKQVGAAAQAATLGVQAEADAGMEAASQAAKQVRKHIVQAGESLSLIAKHYYGDVHRWKEIYEANKAVVGSNPDLIKPGQELVIP